MNRYSFVFAIVAVAAWLGASSSVRASDHLWRVKSPDHGQTFAYGSERNRAWIVQGPDRHLALVMNLTNDPYVTTDYPRMYDNFIFSFPQIVLGKNNHTFYYRTQSGRAIAVAARRPGFLGIEEIKLLPDAYLFVQKPHGYLSLSLIIGDQPFLTGLE